MSGTTAADSSGPQAMTRLEKGMMTLAAALVAIVLAMKFGGSSETLVFVLSALTLVLLAWLLGEATDQLGSVVGSRVAGLMNATLGNLPELVVVVLLIHEAKKHPELIEVAKASLIGSVLGNLLFVLGLAFLVGGLKHGTQTFRRTFASLHATMLVLAVAALAVPELIQFQHEEGSQHIKGISVALAVVLLFVYVAGTRYFIRDSDDAHAPSGSSHPRWPARRSAMVLVLSAIGVGVMSETLVATMEHTISNVGVSASFMGFILVPIVGNLAEHMVAVQLARRDQMDFAMTIALGSSVQVALLIVPLALLFSYAVGNPIDLVFEPRQLLALTLAALIIPSVVNDGESTWIEGLQLLSLYALVAIGFWY